MTVDYRNIQIKYSVDTEQPPVLLPGEFAFTQAGNNLFIGSPDGESGNIRVGGEFNDGILTANQALVANSTGGINRIYTGIVDSDSVTTEIITTSNLTTNYITVDYIDANTGVFSNLEVQTIETNLLYASNLYASKAVFANQISANLGQFSNITVTNISIGNITSVIQTFSANTITANSGQYFDLRSQTITVPQIYSANVSTLNIVSNTGQFTNLQTNAVVSNTANVYQINANIINSINLISLVVTSNNTYSNTISANTITANIGLYSNIISNNISVNNFNTSVFTSANLTANIGNIQTLQSNVINTNIIVSSNAAIRRIFANGSFGQAGYILTSSGPFTNAYWAEQKAPYYVTTEMYDYTQYGLGWMNIAPNQDPQSLGFRPEVTIPYGAIWILAVNDGLLDPPPITVYSPHTRTTPMMWTTIDRSGPYNEDNNPAGQDYWFNITPPPSGA